jgi:hypothetical protein
VAWPHLAQVRRDERHRVQLGTGLVQRDVTNAVTSRPPVRADAARPLAAFRVHRGIENKLHWVRHVAFDEDRPGVRIGAVPQTTVSCRNLAIALLRRAGYANVAAARNYAGRARQAVALVATVLITVLK